MGNCLRRPGAPGEGCPYRHRIIFLIEVPMAVSLLFFARLNSEGIFSVASIFGVQNRVSLPPISQA